VHESLQEAFSSGAVLGKQGARVTVMRVDMTDVVVGYFKELVGKYVARGRSFERITATFVALIPVNCEQQTTSFVLYGPLDHPSVHYAEAGMRRVASSQSAGGGYWAHARAVMWAMVGGALDGYIRGEAVAAPSDGLFAHEFLDASGAPDLIGQSKFVEWCRQAMSSNAGEAREGGTQRCRAYMRPSPSRRPPHRPQLPRRRSCAGHVQARRPRRRP
jgi:hypothetical protein